VIIEIVERRIITILVDHPDGEFGRVHPVKIVYDVIIKDIKNPHGTTVASGVSKREANTIQHNLQIDGKS